MENNTWLIVYSRVKKNHPNWNANRLRSATNYIFRNQHNKPIDNKVIKEDFDNKLRWLLNLV